jgi:hypothetical protein
MRLKQMREIMIFNHKKEYIVNNKIEDQYQYKIRIKIQLN